MITLLGSEAKAKFFNDRWLFRYRSFNYSEIVDFLNGKIVGSNSDIKNTDALTNWWDEISVTESGEVLVRIFFIKKDTQPKAVDSGTFLITGEDARELIGIIKSQWKDCLTKLESLDDLKIEAVKSKTKSDPPPEIKLPLR